MKLTELFLADLEREASANRRVLERVPEGRNDSGLSAHRPPAVCDRGGAAMNGESLWWRLAGLALIVEGCEYDRAGRLPGDSGRSRLWQ